MKKIIFVVLDGAGDRPCPELGGRTPLEAAKKPNIDRLAREGKNGLVYPVKEGFAPESDSAALSLLGYDVLSVYTGRGPLEALGGGLEMREGDLAFRVNFATVGEGDKIIDRRMCRGLSDQEASELTKAINSRVKLSNDLEITMQNFRGYRGVLLIRNAKGKLSSNVSNVDPGYIRNGAFSVPNPDKVFVLKPCEPLDGSRESAESVKAVNEFVEKSKAVLKDHPINIERMRSDKQPANVILLRDAGSSLPKLRNINEKYGARFGMFGEMPCEIGIAKLAGMEVIGPALKGTGRYTRLASAVLKALERLDIVYLHLKGPDGPGHDGDVSRKVEAVEEIDRDFFGNLLPVLKDTVMVVTSDHATPCSLGIHSADPVPLTITGPGVKADGVKTFSERSCGDGDFGLISGGKLMEIALSISR